MAKIIDIKTKQVLANLPYIKTPVFPGRKIWQTNIPTGGARVSILSDTELAAFKRQDIILSELKCPFSMKLVSSK
jgi:hypothetical protein